MKAGKIWRTGQAIDKDGGWFDIVRTCANMAEELRRFHPKNQLGFAGTCF
jgi:hypothetical protein